jgi:HlyD family secretion protein
LLVRSPQQQLAQIAPPGQTTLTEVVTRTVVSKTDRFSGTVSPRQTFSLGLRTPGGIVTRLPVAVGVMVTSGTVVGEVAARPAIAVTLGYPLYRDITPGSTGDDVAAVQDLLRSLGYSTAPDSEARYGRATERALGQFYKDRGYAAPRTSSPSDDDLRVASKAVSDARQALASVPPGQSTAQAASAVNDAVSAYNDLVARSGFVVSQNELIQVPELPAAVLTVTASTGTPLTGPIMELAAGGTVVDIQIPVERIGTITAGMSARVQTASGSMLGMVIAVQQPSTGGSGGSTGATAPPQPSAGSAVVGLSDPASLAGIAVGSTVSVDVILGASAGPVLAVPISAIFQGANGASYVQVMSGSGPPERVAVTIGVIGDGLVEVSSHDQRLTEGAQVVVGARQPSTASGSNLGG